MRITIAVVFFLLTTYASGAMSSSGVPIVIDKVSGRSVKVIQAALPEIIQRNLDIEEYHIVVLESETAYVVLLESPNVAKGQRGVEAGKPGLSVEVDKGTLRVTKVNFVR